MNIETMTLAEIDAAIKQRRQLVGEMVGNLYPAILWDEISRLEDRRDEIIQVLKNEGLLDES